MGRDRDMDKGSSFASCMASLASLLVSHGIGGRNQA
jgi:hypothetical protein